MYESQLLDDWVPVKGATGTVVRLQKAVVPFLVEGRSFDTVVAVANGSTVNDRVLFDVPMDEEMAKSLLLGAVADNTLSVTEQSGDTPDTQTSAAFTAGAVGKAETQVLQGEGGAQEVDEASVCVVTRSAKKRAEDPVKDW